MSKTLPHSSVTPGISRRIVISSALAAAGGAIAFPQSTVQAVQQPKPDERRAATKRYDMKKSINLWAFPYPRADDARASACNSRRTPGSTASS